MKSRKLISLFCAAAMSVSAFTGLVTTASADGETTTLWSDTFNGYDVPETTYSDWLTGVLVEGYGVSGATYKEIEGITLQTGTREGGDDSTYWALAQTDSDKYLATATGRFTSSNRGAKLLFDTEYAATETNDVVIDLDWSPAAEVRATDDKPASGYTYQYGFAVMGKDSSGNAVYTFVDKADVNVEFGAWAEVKAVVTTSGTTVYAGETAVATSKAVSITGLDFSIYSSDAQVTGDENYRIDGTANGYPVNYLNDIVVFNAAAGTGATATVPAAQDHGTIDVTYETVPEGTAPSGMGLVASDNFNDRTSERLIYVGTDSESTYDINTATLRVGPASDATGDTKWSVVGNVNTDPTLGEKYLQANNAARSTSNRGPKLEFKKGEIAERETVVAQFATRLHAGTSSPAEVVFSGDLVASESMGNLASPLALITTDASASSGVYACDNPLTQNGENVIEVEDDTWVLVTIEAYRAEGKTATAKIAVTTDPGTDDEETTYIFGSADAYADLKDSKKSGIKTLPYVSFRSGNDTNYGVSNSSNDIDNIAVYSSNASTDATAEPSVTATMAFTDDTQTAVSITADDDTTATLIQACYNTDGTLSSVASQKVKLTANTAQTVTLTTPHIGDKIMLWNSEDGMKPLCAALKVTTGESQPTAVPATATPVVTAEPTAEPTVAPASVATTAPETEFAGKKASDLGTFAVVVDDSDTTKYNVTGTSNYITGWTEFNAAKTEEQQGNYIAYDLIFPSNFDTTNGVVVAVKGLEGTTDKTITSANFDGTNKDHLTMFNRIGGTSTTATYKLYNTSDTTGDPIATLTVDYSGVTKANPITIAAAEHGTVTTNTTSAVSGAIVTITPTANLGYLIGTVTVAPTDAQSAITVTVDSTNGYTFTMPAEAVTVTVTFTKDPTMEVLSAEAATWVKSGDTDAHNTDELLKVGQLGTDYLTNENTLLRYDLTGIDKTKIVSAALQMNIASAAYNSDRSRWEDSQIVYGVLTDDTWTADKTYSDVSSSYPTSYTTGDWIPTKDSSTASTADHGAISTFTQDITSVVTSETDNTISLVLGTLTARNQVIENAPKLVITLGQAVTFTVKNSADTPAAVEGAVIAIKSGDDVVATITTDSTGTASTALSAGSYKYTVTSADYAIKSDGTLTVADAAVSENVTLSANVPTTITIAAPATGTSVVQGESTTYTATVLDQDGRTMTSPTIDWSVIDANNTAVEGITVTGGTVVVGESVTAGEYTVKATVNGTEVSDTEALTVVAAEALSLSITSENSEYGTVSYTVNGVASTATSVNKGKTIVATATPVALYGFKGWATSSDNATAGTYVSTDATYTFTLSEATTLIACFEYTGVYYSEDFNDSAVTTSGTSVETSNYTIVSQDGLACIYQLAEGNNYALMSPSGGGGRGMAFTFKNLPDTIDKDYTLEMDISLATGNSGTSHNVWLATSSVSGGNTTAPTSYAFNLCAANYGDTAWTVSTLASGATATTATINSATRRTSSSAPAAASEWSHVKMVVDVSEKTAELTITTGSNTFKESITFTGDSVTPTAIKMAAPRYNPVLALDNIKIYVTETN